VPLLIGIGFLPVAAGEFHLGVAGPAGSHAVLLQALLLVVVATGLIGGLAFVVPRVRHAWASRGRPQFASAWANVYEVTAHIGPVVRLLAGPALTQVVLAAGLGWCLHAVGASANFGALMFVCCAGSVLGAITPVPGGMGVVEATYIAGLTLVGVPQDLAAVATLLYRSCTTYIPALWGWPAYAHLREGDY
jgi:undecaprenyl-diphosphatase